MVHHRHSLEEALRLLQDKSAPAVGAVDGEGRLVGLVTPENLGEMMLLHAARPARASPWQRPA